MGLKNKNKAAQTKATFSVPKKVFYPHLKTENSTLEKVKDPTAEQAVLNTSESIAGIDPAAIKQIEETLKLTFLSEKDKGSAVCMANNPEVRDEFKDIFDIKDLLDYSYAVLHLPSNLEKYKDVSKIDSFQVFYPNSPNHFWKLVNLGSKLQTLNLSELSDVEKQKNKTANILKKIAEINIE